MIVIIYYLCTKWIVEHFLVCIFSAVKKFVCKYVCHA